MEQSERIRTANNLPRILPEGSVTRRQNPKSMLPSGFWVFFSETVRYAEHGLCFFLPSTSVNVNDLQLDTWPQRIVRQQISSAAHTPNTPTCTQVPPSRPAVTRKSILRVHSTCVPTSLERPSAPSGDQRRHTPVVRPWIKSVANGSMGAVHHITSLIARQRSQRRATLLAQEQEGKWV
jgi:hypothetical protein